MPGANIQKIMLDFLKEETSLIICDVGASPIDKTEFIDDLFNNTNSKLIVLIKVILLVTRIIIRLR